MISQFPLAKILNLVALIFLTVTTCPAQELSPPEVASDIHTFASTQTASRRNYALLQPISAQKPVEPQTSQQRQMLEPLNRQDRPAAQNGIIVVPKSFRRKIFDQHQFVVRNEGTKILRSATVVLTAPIGSTIQQVSPKPDQVSGREVAFSIIGLAPGTEKTIEVAIVYPRNELARFSSTIEDLEWAGEMKKSQAQKVVPQASYSMPAVGMLQPKQDMKALNVSATSEQLLQNQFALDEGAAESQLEPALQTNMLAPIAARTELAGNSLAEEGLVVETDDVVAGNAV